jgi:hypothetical protein
MPASSSIFLAISASGISSGKVRTNSMTVSLLLMVHLSSICQKNAIPALLFRPYLRVILGYQEAGAAVMLR